MTRSREVSKGATRNEFVYTATSQQTTFSGNDDSSNSLAYTAGQIDVFVNGIRQAAADYTATNGTSVVLAAGAQPGDSLVVVAHGTVNLASNILSGDLDLAGNELILDADNDTTITADTDDQIDIKIAGNDDFKFSLVKQNDAFVDLASSPYFFLCKKVMSPFIDELKSLISFIFSSF